MSSFKSSMQSAEQKLKVIQFGTADWSIDVVAMPEVKGILTQLQEENIQIWHSGLTLKFRGEDKAVLFNRSKALLEGLRSLRDFEDFLIGTAEGRSENIANDRKIEFQAIKNGLPNQPPNPTCFARGSS